MFNCTIIINLCNTCSCASFFKCNHLYYDIYNVSNVYNVYNVYNICVVCCLWVLCGCCNTLPRLVLFWSSVFSCCLLLSFCSTVNETIRKNIISSLAVMHRNWHQFGHLYSQVPRHNWDITYDDIRFNYNWKWKENLNLILTDISTEHLISATICGLWNF